MIRTILFAAFLVSAVVVKAQTPLTFGSMNQPAFRHFHQVADTITLKKKWFVGKYADISSGFMAFNGGSGAFLSAPMGVQVYRQLNNNVYAFAGLSVAPTIFQFNNAFYQPAVNKYNNFMMPNHFGTYSTAHMGLMYINSDRTFSISGSIGVSRSNYYGRQPYVGHPMER